MTINKPGRQQVTMLQIILYQNTPMYNRAQQKTPGTLLPVFKIALDKHK